MRIDGGTSSNMRQTNVHEFQTFKKPQVSWQIYFCVND